MFNPKQVIGWSIHISSVLKERWLKWVEIIQKLTSGPNWSSLNVGPPLWWGDLLLKTQYIQVATLKCLYVSSFFFHLTCTIVMVTKSMLPPILINLVITLFLELMMSERGMLLVMRAIVLSKHAIALALSKLAINISMLRKQSLERAVA